MGRDSYRIAAPDNCSSPNTFRVHESIKTIVDENGTRSDGRTKTDPKSLTLEVGLVPSVSGSAYMEFGKTKILCSVNGPRDLSRMDSSMKGQLFCDFKYASFSCTEKQPYQPTEEELSIGKSIQYALEPVVLLHKFPKSKLDISVLVLENDGGVISAAITCAGAALSNAGVEMYDLPVGSKLVYCNSEYFLDPTAEEELYAKSNENAVEITIAMMAEYKSQIIFNHSKGCINPTVFFEGMKLLQSSCHEMLTKIKMHIRQHVIEMNSVSEDQLEDISLNKKFSSTVKILQPHKYMSIFLQNKIRPDGRELMAFRPIVINVNCIGTAMGSALVRLGRTLVLCGIKAELTNPLPSDPDKGFFVPNVTLSSVCSNKYFHGPPTQQAQVYSQMIMDLWRTSEFLNPKDLCILPEKLAWCIFPEMVCLSCDGNVLDACVLALMAALSHTKLPEVIVNEESNEISVNEKFEKLNVDHLLFSATYSILKENAVADPTSEEESLEVGSVVTLLKGGDDISVQSIGPITEEMLFQCISSSRNRYYEMKSLLEAVN